MKRGFHLIVIMVLQLGCITTQSTSNSFSISEEERLSVLFEEVIKTKNKPSLPTNFYSDIYEENPDYVKSILDKKYPSTPDSVYEKALYEVKRDILTGNLLIKQTGLGVVFTTEDGSKWDADRVYADLLQEKFRVRVDRISGDLVSSQIKLYKETYNSISLEVINRFHRVKNISETVKELIPKEIEYQGEKRKEWRYSEE